VHRMRKRVQRKGLFCPCLLAFLKDRMPAADLSRLQAQISAISTQFKTPSRFVKSLTALMELYSDSHFQTGNSIKIEILMPSYRLPFLVMRQLETDLSSLTYLQPDPALEIMDLLWQKTFFETRMLAITMLGNLPIDILQPMRERFLNWVQPGLENHLMEALLNKGSFQLRQNKIDEWLRWAKKWIIDKNPEVEKIGLRSLKIVCSDSHYINFPAIFSIIEPIILKPIFPIQKELTSLFKTIIGRVPMETLSFFRSILVQSQSNEIKAFVRRCLPFFEKDVQQSLKSIL